jgi:hypothetical protein
LTVSEKVAVCCSEPDVAVTMTVAVTGCGGVDGSLEEDPPEPPPHPLSGHRAATLNARSSGSGNRNRFRQKTQPSASARSEPGSNGLELCRRAAAVDAVIVTVVETGEPDGDAVVGEKVQDVPEGSPEQPNETAASNPFSGVTDMETDPLCPAVMVSVEGEAVREKSCAGGGGGSRTLKDAAAIALFE